jgi:DNA processing protein
MTGADATSLDTQAVLLLTAPLIIGRRDEGLKPLNASEYQRVADHLMALDRRPGDLLQVGSEELRADCAKLKGAQELEGLLRRGMLLSQALDRWATRGIWVVSRADEKYPRRLIASLGTAAPPVLYGTGDISLLSHPALGVVGSRKAPKVALEVAAEAGAGAARIGALLVSGNAQGIDRAAMQATADAGGVVVAVLADGLEKQALVPENREAIHDGRLVLVSPYDPGVGRSIGLLMGRNKVIYGLCDAVLVADTKHREGGTWAGAHEHLTKKRPATVFIRTDEPTAPGQEALLELGGQVWPEAYDDIGLRSMVDPPAAIATATSLPPPKREPSRSESAPPAQIGMFSEEP